MINRKRNKSRIGFNLILNIGTSPLLSFLAGINLRRKCLTLKKLEDYVNLALNYQFIPFKRLPFKITIKSLQIKSEIIEFIKILKKNKLKIILEIGTARGGTLFLLTKFSGPSTILISLDLPGGKFGGGYPRSIIPLYKSFASNNQKIYLIRGNSHDLSSLDKVKKILKDKKIDILFIDGDHSYKGVKKDFEMYGPLVKKNGMIAFHDIVKHPKEIDCEVHNFWNEIKNNFKYKELVEDMDQNQCGIGIIKKTENNI